MQQYYIEYHVGDEQFAITLSAPDAMHAVDLVELALGGAVTRLRRV